MFFTNHRSIFLIICIYVVVVESLGGGGRSGGGSGKSGSTGKSGKSGAKGFLGEPTSSKLTSNNVNNVVKPKMGGSGIFSAWGIISIVMVAIVGTGVGYYTYVFYPLVCAERGKYDVMEMTAL